MLPLSLACTYSKANTGVLPYAEHYEQNADQYWDTFYKKNDDRFFSDRHYLQHEFPELFSGSITLLEVMLAISANDPTQSPGQVDH